MVLLRSSLFTFELRRNKEIKVAIHKTEAIVLKTQNFRQTSLLVNFYSRDFGKLSGLLKGVRQNPEKFNSSVDTFSFNEIIFYQSTKSSLHLVSQCDLKKDFRAIKNNLDKMKKAFSLLELVNLLTVAEDKNVQIFELMLSCLEEINNNFDIDKILIIFKIKLLDYCGFKPHIDSCVACGDKIISQARFSFKLGGLLCDRCASKDIKSRNVFRGSVASILYIEKNDFGSVLRLGMNHEIKKELNQILDAFLEFHLGKISKSEKVFEVV